MQADTSLKIESEPLEDRQVQLTVEVSEERVGRALRSAARRLSRQTRIPGFRPGKAPYDVVARKLGPDLIFEEALDSMGQEIYRSALESADLEPYAPGSLDEVISREPLILRYTVPLSPKVELGPYEETRIEFEEAEVEDEAVDEVMEDLRQGQALVEPADRPAELSDVVVLNVHGELSEPEQDSEAALVEEAEVSVLIEPETDWPFPGVSDHLVGLTAGSEITVDHEFGEDYPNESLRGKVARFEIECLEVKSRLVPDWSDDLAGNLGEFESLLDLRIKVREQLQEQAQRQAEADYAQVVVESVVRGASIEYPPVLLERELQEMIEDLEARLRRQNLTLEDYLKIEKQSREELLEEIEPQARERLKRGLVLGRVVEVEDLDVADEDVDAELDRMVESLGEHAGEVRKALDTRANRSRIAVDALTQKAVNRLVEIARGGSMAEESEPEDGNSEQEGDDQKQVVDNPEQE